MAGVLRSCSVPHFLRTRKRDRITILCLHRVNDELHHVWPAFSPKAFAGLVQYIQKHYHVCLPEQMHEPSRKPKLILTFDDGYYDFMEFVLPVLAKHRLPAIHHVVVHSVVSGKPNWTYLLNLVVDDHLKSRKELTVQGAGISYRQRITVHNAAREAVVLYRLLRYLDATERDSLLEQQLQACTGDLYLPRMMRADDLLECISAGIAIGSHSMSHCVLSGVKDTVVLKKEIVESCTQLRELTRQPIRYFAFPNGEFDSSALFWCREAGYQYLFTTEEYLPPIAQLQQSEPVLLPRLSLPPVSVDEAILYVEGLHLLARQYGC